jgi:hypothetical protein
MSYSKYQVKYLLSSPVIQEKYLITQSEFINLYKPALVIISKTKDIKKESDGTIKKLPEGISQNDIDNSIAILKKLPEFYFTSDSPLGKALSNNKDLETVISKRIYTTKIEFKQII